MKLYAITYEGFTITKIGATNGSIVARAQQLGFLKSDRLQIAFVEVDNPNAESLAHVLAEKKGGKCYESILTGNFQDPVTREGFVMNSGHTEVFNITFKQAKRVLREVKSYLSSPWVLDENPLTISGTRETRWADMRIEEI